MKIQTCLSLQSIERINRNALPEIGKEQLILGSLIKAIKAKNRSVSLNKDSIHTTIIFKITYRIKGLLINQKKFIIKLGLT
jgi:hypothetical protein